MGEGYGWDEVWDEQTAGGASPPSEGTLDRECSTAGGLPPPPPPEVKKYFF